MVIKEKKWENSRLGTSFLILSSSAYSADGIWCERSEGSVLFEPREGQSLTLCTVESIPTQTPWFTLCWAWWWVRARLFIESLHQLFRTQEMQKCPELHNAVTTAAALCKKWTLQGQGSRYQLLIVSLDKLHSGQPMDGSIWRYGFSVCFAHKINYIDIMQLYCYYDIVYAYYIT